MVKKCRGTPNSEYPCDRCAQKVTAFGNVALGEDNAWLHHGGVKRCTDPINDKSWTYDLTLSI